ncbi:hypothetical protein VB734_05145, partial [Synechococcus sp. BA-124 BA4]|nr:hypothetical protein [Synechococcus sp. BA-124 BA4]
MKSLLRRLRAELFATPADAVLSLVLITLLSLGGFGVLRWALTQAQWAVVKVNSTLFAVGRYLATRGKKGQMAALDDLLSAKEFANSFGRDTVPYLRG